MSSISNSNIEQEQNILSVSQLSNMIQRKLSSEFSSITIRGEISGLKYHTSGHVYFNLKDEGAVINAVCWRGTASKLPFKLEEGLEVVVFGNVSTYPARSNYQLICENIRASGLGALMALLEERRKKLAAEGLFDQARKKELPYMPSVIGVVTSPTGAVIKDILHRISDRFGVHVLVYPVAVQGDGAAEQVAAGIEFFNGLKEGAEITRPDVLIVARGGGSIEDLWAFNEEIVVRAAANSNIPLISAVGHETDTTLIDFASDRRAPTPTAAAEMAVPVKAEIMAGIMDLKKRGYSGINRYIANLENLLKARRQGLISPRQMLMNMRQRLDDLGERLNNGVFAKVRNHEQKLAHASERYSLLSGQLLKMPAQKLEGLKALLASYNYKNVLKRGFAVVTGDDGVIKTVKEFQAGNAATIEVSDGKIGAVIGEGSGGAVKKAAKKSPVKKDSKNKNTNEGQGSLF